MREADSLAGQGHPDRSQVGGTTMVQTIANVVPRPLSLDSTSITWVGISHLGTYLSLHAWSLCTQAGPDPSKLK